MLDWSKILSRLFTGIWSILDASNLRNRIAELENEHELMWTSLDDMARMYKDHPAGKYAQKTLDNVTHKYGR